MKKALSALVSASMIVLPALAFAQPGELVKVPEGPRTINDFLDDIVTATTWIFSILLIVAVVFILLAAFDFVTQGGDLAKVQGARQKLMYAAIGVVIAVAARGIVTVAQSFIGP